MADGNSRAVLTGLFAGVCWGIFWLPLRMIEQAGLDAPWAMVVFLTLPALLSVPAVWILRADYAQGLRPLLGVFWPGLPLHCTRRDCFIPTWCARCSCST